MNYYRSPAIATRSALDDFEVVAFKPKHLDAVKSLLTESFGGIAESRGALDKNILKYYKLVLDEDVLVSLTGIVPSDYSVFDGYEVSWTCTSPKYRNGGICTELLRKCILELPDDGIPVFCDCWRFPGCQINLLGPMLNNGFRLLVPEASVFSTKFSKICKSCPYEHRGEFGCKCYTDIWKLERKPVA